MRKVFALLGITLSSLVYSQQQYASYYGDNFHNRNTASGKRLNIYGDHCAHKTYPFGTKLLITNTNTGATAVCTVIDRGPFVKNRVLDLTTTTFKQLGGKLRDGLIPVTVKVHEQS
jgi:rlpA-like lipoprotein|nr:MAG TPA: lipoprotein [Caudoviricetes sp.]